MNAGVAALAFSLSVSMGLLAGRHLPAFLASLSARQHAYEDAPATHQTKTGTPTMGGILFLVIPVAAAFAAVPFLGARLGALILLMVACAAIGAYDDFLGIRFGRNRGLRARTKFLLTALAGVAFLWLLGWTPVAAPVAVFGLGWAPPALTYLLSLCVILATTHAVNLTDGLDGLASGTIVPPLAVFAFVAFALGMPDAGAFAVATIGATLAFLTYNMHPAKMFMGDTGSLALGGALAGVAIVTGMHLLLLLVGGVFAAEALSVIVQVTSYKMTRRRVFRMSPLHHHFELGGWPETKVTARFWIASIVLSLAGFALVRTVHA